ncbi:MAG: NAD(P)/FAD-dependent oxidoreductase [Myxococcales bacterium]|nr:NAD(P)/FAD-dependent oxidoreductase [Myxococcales bacterium]
MTAPQIIEIDTVIVGAGPVGLFQVFELGLLGLKTAVIDALPHIGGQCVELYPDKPIYDIPAVPMCTGQALIDNLMAQIQPFLPEFYLGQQVEKVEKRGEGDFVVETSAGTVFHTRAVIIAAGVGAFSPRKLSVEGLEAFEGQNFNYRVKNPERYHGKDVVIFGGGDSALDWALALAEHANVVLIHRRAVFKAQPASVARMRALCAEEKMQYLEGRATEIIEKKGALRGIKVRGADGVTRSVQFDELLCFFGLAPKLGPIAEWGLDLDKKSIAVDTEKFQTSVPGIFAIGDINTYPGKKKLILSGFHEAALAAFAVYSYLNPEERVFLQYTTTSPKMHQRLGVEDPYKDDPT